MAIGDRRTQLAILVATALIGAGCDIFTALNGGAGLGCYEDESCPAGMLCVDHECQPASARADAGTADRPVDAALLDRALPDVLPRDQAGSDLAAADGARPDAGHGDQGPRDATIAEQAWFDRRANDGSGADRMPGDRAVADSSSPGEAASSDGPDFCGNGRVDPEEDCDGQVGCSDQCVPLDSYDCRRNMADRMVCFRDFPVGAPANVSQSYARPQDLQDVFINCAADPCDTSATVSSVTLCGVDLPVIIVPQSDGQELFVMFARGLTVTGQLRFEGSRIPVFVVYGDVVITNSIDVGAGATSGPGADSNCGASRGHNGANGSSCGGGAGGGGNLTAGGTGGTSGTGIGAAGVPRVSTLALQGGCSGGAGGYDDQIGGSQAAGGAGGGALQISAAGMFAITGTIYADGAGGVGGARSNKGGGGGGGSGGTILVEARVLAINQDNFVLVGGGGGGGASASVSGSSGISGRNGGSGGAGVSGYGAGGHGSTSSTTAGSNGADGTTTTDIGAGGGGGGHGQLIVHTL